MAGHASLAEHYRRHRAAFNLALETGCTPKDAEREIDRRESRERCQAAERRLQAKIAAPCSSLVGRAGHDPEEPRAPWWRED